MTVTSSLKVFHQLPEGLLACEAHELRDLLGGPCLIHLSGRQQPALFVSVLLHGNETSGWEAMRELLQHYAERTLPRDLSLFIGNVAAAEQGLRALPGQQDFNRIWCQEERESSPEQALAAAVVAEMQTRGLFASIDIHNNTGRNPHYGCINVLDDKSLYLASLFSRTVVYFTEPHSVQSMAFSKLCPAVTVECGRPEEPQGAVHAREFVDAALHLAVFPSHPPAAQDVDIFHTVAIIKIPPQLRFGFRPDTELDIVFSPELDCYNFRELAAGTPIAEIAAEGVQLQAWDENGKDMGEAYFYTVGQQLCLAREVMPSMLTLDETIIRQDCLCYFMERLPSP